jgi:photosystem II stability/assembly factor-like uncharacterized protein
MKHSILFSAFLFCLNINTSAQWVQQNVVVGYPVNFYDVHLFNASTGIVGGYYGDTYGWMYRTTNGGNNWSAAYQTQNPLNQFEAISFASGTVGLAVGGGIFGNGSFIVRTTNGGVNWTTQSTGTNYYHLDVQLIDANTGYISGYAGTIFKTTDGGLSWAAQISGTSRRLYGISFINVNTGTIVGDTGTVIRTTNGGVNWSMQNSGTNTSLFDVSFIDANNGIAAGGLGLILRTTNAGANWVQQNSGVSVTLLGLSFISINTCTVVGASGTIVRTTNGGINWIPQSSGTSQTLRAVSFIDVNTGSAVGDNHIILRTTNGGVTFINPVGNKIPSAFHLYQNYPNPFNTVTKIEFDIPSNEKRETSNVKITIYDALGREVVTLVNEVLKPRSYEVEWNASNYPSGVYYCGIAAGEFKETMKMVLIK